jgi:ubiquinone/menaquinone biosynthesis C-methylase UbiE
VGRAQGTDRLLKDDVGTAEAAWLGYKARSFELLALAGGDHVLDVGCGTGEDVRTIAGRAPDVSATGIDASEDKIREARARTLGLPRPVDFRVGDAYAIPFEDETFDACRADRVFHHLVDPSKALAEMVRVTRSGGRVVVCDTDYDSLFVEAG